jgi:hypothetical protein
MLHRFHKGGHCGNIDTLASNWNSFLDKNKPLTQETNSKQCKKISSRIPISSNQSQSHLISPDKLSTAPSCPKTITEEAGLLEHQQYYAITEGITGSKPFKLKTSLAPSHFGQFENAYNSKSSLSKVKPPHYIEFINNCAKHLLIPQQSQQLWREKEWRRAMLCQQWGN